MTYIDDRVARQRARVKAWYDANREYCLARARSRAAKWAADNPDRVRAYRKEYYAKNRDILIEKQRKYYAEHSVTKPTKIAKTKKEINAKYYAAHKERTRERLKIWRKKNPDAASAQIHRRRATKLKSQEHYTADEITALRKAIGSKCAHCGIKGRMTIDHITPLSKGGSNAISNIQFLCSSCNSRKSYLDPIEFARINGRLL